MSRIQSTRAQLVTTEINLRRISTGRPSECEAVNYHRIKLLRENLIAVERTLELKALSDRTRAELMAYRDELIAELRVATQTSPNESQAAD